MTGFTAVKKKLAHLATASECGIVGEWAKASSITYIGALHLFLMMIMKLMMVIMMAAMIMVMR